MITFSFCRRLRLAGAIFFFIRILRLFPRETKVVRCFAVVFVSHSALYQEEVSLIICFFSRLDCTTGIVITVGAEN